MYKGHDRADIVIRVKLNNGYDEIKQYVDGRYVTAPESEWRNNEF
jgi:hypothetical protein